MLFLPAVTLKRYQPHQRLRMLGSERLCKLPHSEFTRKFFDQRLLYEEVMRDFRSSCGAGHILGGIHSCLFVPATAWSFDVLHWQPMTTLARAFAKDLPIPRPMPLPPPVTNAVLFAKSCITGLLPCFALSVRSLFLHRDQVPGERARNHFCLLRCPEQGRAFVLHRVEEPQNTHSFSVP